MYHWTQFILRLTQQFALLTMAILWSSEQIEQASLEGDWPGFQDLCYPKAILMIIAGGDEEGETVEKTDIFLVPRKRGR